MFKPRFIKTTVIFKAILSFQFQEKSLSLSVSLSLSLSLSHTHIYIHTKAKIPLTFFLSFPEGLILFSSQVLFHLHFPSLLSMSSPLKLNQVIPSIIPSFILCYTPRILDNLLIQILFVLQGVEQFYFSHQVLPDHCWSYWHPSSTCWLSSFFSYFSCAIYSWLTFCGW